MSGPLRSAPFPAGTPKADAALNIFAKPWQTALSVLSLIRYAGTRLGVIHLQYEPFGSRYDRLDPMLLSRYVSEELGRPCASQEVRDVYEVFLSQGHYFIPGAPELLEELSPRYDLYLASNGTAVVQAGRLESAGITRYFKGIFISEKMGANKPSPAYFQACFDAIPGFDPAAAVMVGDSLTSDIRGARSVGLRSCWFNPQGLPPRPDIPADYTIRSLAELPPLLERL